MIKSIEVEVYKLLLDRGFEREKCGNQISYKLCIGLNEARTILTYTDSDCQMGKYPEDQPFKISITEKFERLSVEPCDYGASEIGYLEDPILIIQALMAIPLV